MAGWNVKPHPKTGAPCVLIRAGSYPYGILREGHVGRHDLDRDLWADVFPVRLRDFGQFVAAGGYFTREYWSEPPHALATGRRVGEGRADELLRAIGYEEELCLSPVVGLNWYEATAYARWAGGALPSELEWAVAAWGTRTVQDADAATLLGIPLGCICPIPAGGRTARRHFISERGCYGMGVMVREWCRDALSLSQYPAPDNDVDGVKTVRGNPSLLGESVESVLWDRAHRPCSDVVADQLIGFRCVYEALAWEGSRG